MFSHRFNPFLVGAVALLKTSSYLLTWNHHQAVPTALANDELAVSTTTMYTDTIVMATVATVTLPAAAATSIIETITTTVIKAAPTPSSTTTTSSTRAKQEEEEDYPKQSADIFAYLLTFIQSSSYFPEHVIESIQPIYEWYRDHEFLFQILGAIASCLPIWLCKRKYTKTITRQQQTIDSLTSRLKAVHLDHAQLQLVHQTNVAQHHDLVNLHAKQQNQIDRLKVDVLHGQEKALIFAQRHSQMADVTEKAQLDLRDLQRRFNQVRAAYKNLFAVLPEIAFRENVVADDHDIGNGDSALLAIANMQNEMRTIEN